MVKKEQTNYFLTEVSIALPKNLIRNNIQNWMGQRHMRRYNELMGHRYNKLLLVQPSIKNSQRSIKTQKEIISAQNWYLYRRAYLQTMSYKRRRCYDRCRINHNKIAMGILDIIRLTRFPNYYLHRSTKSHPSWSADNGL